MENANLMNVSYPGNIAHYQVPKMVYCSKVNGVPQWQQFKLYRKESPDAFESLESLGEIGGRLIKMPSKALTTVINT